MSQPDNLISLPPEVTSRARERLEQRLATSGSRRVRTTVIDTDDDLDELFGRDAESALRGNPDLDLLGQHLTQGARRLMAVGGRSATGLSGWLTRHKAAVSRAVLAAFGLGLAATVAWELSTSGLEAMLASGLASQLTYQVSEVRRPEWPMAPKGPYDVELGYARLPEFAQRLKTYGYKVDSQAQVSPYYVTLARAGVFPPYQEKSAHGLTIHAPSDATLFANQFPAVRYDRFSDVPNLMVRALLFIEDRQVLAEGAGVTLNPAVSWDRLGKATLELILDKLLKARNVPGGSTLATQIEKFRHARGGRTHSAGDKVKQMASATARAYLLGQDTRAAREQIVLDYINEVPLGAVPGVGQVAGMAQGLETWFGADLAQVGRLLDLSPNPSDVTARRAKAVAFKRVLALFLSQRRPSYYLQKDQAALARLTAKHLNVMGKLGIIDGQLMSDALAVDLSFLPADQRRPAAADHSFVAHKASNAIRVELQRLLGLNTLYELDRLDADVHGTFLADLQRRVADSLVELRSEGGARKAGMIGERMLLPGQADRIHYSFTLIERQTDRNLVRVQADTVDGPLDLNRGGKLELGSTAKLRTLITFLEMHGELYDRLAPHAADAAWLAAEAQRLHREDEMSLWAVAQFQGKQAAPTRDEFLAAASERKFSASPYQPFFTGGGQMHFNNFDPNDNGLDMTVAQAFQRSNNLVFVRVMRDIVQHVIFSRIKAAGTMLAEESHPQRWAYLERFAEAESGQFLSNFYRKLQPLTGDGRLELLASAKHLTTSRLAALLLTLRPDLDYLGFRIMLRERFPDLESKVIERYYLTMRPSVMSLNDRAYVAKVHPLALWTAAHLSQHPHATLNESLAASKDARRDAYRWLMERAGPKRQERDVRTMLEREAFRDHLLAYWQRQGFPFDRMVPSYASALGSSGDRPSALAELMGAMHNSGVLVPTVRFDDITIGRGTPYETTFKPAWLGARRAASPEVAGVVRRLLVSVVDGGTARRLKGSIHRTDGSEIAIAAKTGTGDNRVGGIKKSRTATLVFAIGDRFYGAMTAFVKPRPGEDEAALTAMSFTSSLVVQALKSLLPTVQPVVLGVEDPLAFAISD